MDENDKNFVGKVLILLVLLSIIAAITDIRKNPKKYITDSVIQFEHQK